MLEILTLTICFYIILRVLRNTPGIFAFFSLVAVIAGVATLAYFTEMPALAKLSNYIFSQLPLVIIVIFQQDIRRMLVLLTSVLNGRTQRVFRKINLDRKQRERVQLVEEILHAVCSLTARSEWREFLHSGKCRVTVKNSHLSPRNTGALIALQGQQGLSDYIDHGSVPLDCQVNSLLLQNIFYPGSPLHDGGVIIKGSRLVAASSTFPLAQSYQRQTSGTRHLAALGLASRTDAMVIVVSEESGSVSVAHEGQDESAVLTRMNSPLALRKMLQNRFAVEDDEGGTSLGFIMRLFRHLATRSSERNEVK